jgi:hypothetical protein
MAPIPDWSIVYLVALVLGLVVGLMLRFLLTLVVVATIVFIVGTWVFGLLDPAAFAQLPRFVEQYLGGVSVGPQTFLSVGGLVFLGGVLGGVLLTSRLRGLEHARSPA